MPRRDDEPVAGMIGALATAIAIALPAYLPDDALDWIDEPESREHRSPGCTLGRYDELATIDAAGRSTKAVGGLGGEDDALLVEHGRLDAPDDVCVDVRALGSSRRGAVQLRVESSMPAGVFVSMGGIEIESRPLDADDDRPIICSGHVERLEIDVPRRRRRPVRIDVEVILYRADGSKRVTHRSLDVRPRRTT